MAAGTSSIGYRTTTIFILWSMIRPNADNFSDLRNTFNAETSHIEERIMPATEQLIARPGRPPGVTSACLYLLNPSGIAAHASANFYP